MVKLLDGSMWAGLKEFGFDGAQHKPHWTFEANQNPDLIRNVYQKNLDIGVDYITTNTYHFGSTLHPDFAKETVKYETYFKAACDALENLTKNSEVRVLGSVGTFATYFHDCSEYTGAYADLPNINVVCSKYFRKIFETFQKFSNIRELIIETIPTSLEVVELLKIVKDFPDFKIVISFTLNENGNLRHGENLETIVKSLKACEQVIGVGINCTDPQNVLAALKILKPHMFENVFVYPNIGDQSFLDNENNAKFVYNNELVKLWIDNGATVIGGCCGVDSDNLKQLKILISDHNAEERRTDLLIIPTFSSNDTSKMSGMKSSN